ncbi:c-type cytochrome [Psychrobacter sp. F1192]|uniref:C-type cytochrome n=1 Tax=Psychrobacter coccoides TaxID=2818440 RepID=A0ABS3NNP3_9GAMM|nr:cytochrome c [Psychrobacter coccoides]MBO1531036.1 c-type cytochrome [Psychrobacter coccoides]
MKPLSVMLSMLAIGITSSAAMAQGASVPSANLPNVSPANSDLVNKGAYIARAADCMACHREDYTGGVAIETPMGSIYATNITPSKRYGIGNYTEADLKKALQKGRAPDHMLYPAMPYPSYNSMTDEDISALFAYLQTVPVYDQAPDYKTDLPFPFNIRTLMLGWNVLNIPATTPREGLTETQQRGEYLVDTLGHCGTCHTPRNSTMGFDTSKYLSGAPLGSWYAPNITPDKSSGIGSWSEQDIVTYLRTGELDQRAFAGGPMGEAVAHSTRYLKNEDLGAIASYLKAVPAIQTDDKVTAVDASRLPSPINESITHDLVAQKRYLAEAKAEVANGSHSPEALYLATCASCHGVDGYGQPDAQYSPIVGLSSIRREKPDALVNMILHGIEGSTNTSPIMPGFADELNDEQVASIANYVRINFGGLTSSDVDAADVNRIAVGVDQRPFLIKYAGLLAVIGIIVALVIVFFIIRAIVRSRRHQ